MKEFILSTQGAELFVREYGLLHGPEVVLMHGGPGIAGTLSDLGKDIQRYARVIEYDQRGTERSASGGPFSVAQHLHDLRTVIEKTGLQKPVLITLLHAYLSMIRSKK